MLNEEDELLLTQTEPGTPLNRLMRAYWIPVLRSAQLAKGGAPVRFKVLGQTYVGFRGHDGRAGVINEPCPHRGASMALARNEPGGLRCVYHGWKMDAGGRVIEAPTHPEDFALHKLKAKAYPLHEGQGIVWAWLGEGSAPAFRPLAFTGLPDDQVLAATVRLNCGWLPPLETLWDVFHAQILHNETNRKSRRGSVYFSGGGRTLDNGMHFDYPEFHVESTPFGFRHVNTDAVKRTHFEFIAPFIQHHTLEPGPKADKGLQIFVPIDDDHTMLWMIFYNRTGPLSPEGFARRGLDGVPDLNDFMAHLGSRTPDNHWGQNRDAVDRGESLHGIAGDTMLTTIFGEDLMVIESQPSRGRCNETLGLTDKALSFGRRRLLEIIRQHESQGIAAGRDMDLSGVEARYELVNDAHNRSVPTATPA